MRIRDPKLLVAYMDHKDFSQSRLARYVGCSRQFIHLLVTGQRTTCTKEIGNLIEEALDTVPGTLFLPQKSPVTRPSVPSRRTAA